MPESRLIAPYPPALAGGPRGDDSARVQIAVDHTGAVHECAVTVLAVSDSALLPHVPAAAARLRFQPARHRGAAVPAWLVLTLRFGTAEEVAARASARPVRTEVVVDQPPTLLPGGPQPVYPAELIPRRVAGQVVVRATVTTEGRIESGSVRVVRSDHPLFLAAVRDILPRLRFSPGRRGPGGPPVASMVQLPFEFQVPFER